MEASQGMTPVIASDEVIRREEDGVQLSVAVATPVAEGLTLVLQNKFKGPGQVITGFTLSI